MARPQSVQVAGTYLNGLEFADWVGFRRTVWFRLHNGRDQMAESPRHATLFGEGGAPSGRASVRGTCDDTVLGRLVIA